MPMEKQKMLISVAVPAEVFREIILLLKMQQQMLPVDPVSPVGPVLPVDPVSPVGPVLPVDPVSPVGPVLPVDPVSPVGPVGPATPRI